MCLLRTYWKASRHFLGLRPPNGAFDKAKAIANIQKILETIP